VPDATAGTAVNAEVGAAVRGGTVAGAPSAGGVVSGGAAGVLAQQVRARPAEHTAIKRGIPSKNPFVTLEA